MKQYRCVCTPEPRALCVREGYAGSVRIAMRVNEAITWLLSDHLGSTSITVDASGSLLGSLKFTAYGELRSGSSTTDYQYTGQRNEVEIGLYYYVACFYDPQLARFISADTIIPEPGSIKGYDRYAYVNGNPISFNDPSGHQLWDGDGGGGSGTNLLAGIIAQKLNNLYNWSFSGTWNLSEINEVRQAGKDIQTYIETYGGNGQQWIQTYLGGVSFAKEQLVSFPSPMDGRYANLGTSMNDLLGGVPAFVFPGNQITFKNSGIGSKTIVHELGHVLDNWGGSSQVFEAAIVGGGWSDKLIEYLGGTPYGLRCSAPTPLENKYLPINDYGMKHQADFFAQHFMYQVYGYPGNFDSKDAGVWVNVFFSVTISKLP